MHLKDFPAVQVDKPGKFRIVPEATLTELLQLINSSGAVQKETKYLKVQSDVAALTRKFREAKNWTQEAMANEVKISLRSVTNIEGARCQRKPHFKTFELLMNNLGSHFRTELAKLIPTDKKNYNQF